MLSLLTVAVLLIAYGVVSRPLDRRGITSALFFTTTGFVVGTAVLGLVDVQLDSTFAERFTEIALSLLLFSDAARLDLRSLRRQLAWPSRLLLIGLPLTMVAGVGVGMLVFPGMTFVTAFLLSVMLAPTDAALGQRVVADPDVPARIRQALDVESGLNDGLAVPFFLVAADIAKAELSTGVTAAVVQRAAQQIGWGLLAGLAAGVAGGLLYRLAARRDWLEAPWRQIVPFAAAVLSFALAGSLGGSGFIAAFVAGAAFGRTSGEHGLAVTYFTEETGGVLAAVTWVGFGALALGWAVHEFSWQILLYAVLSLTVVRVIPVAIAMAGRGARLPTIAFIGWFGPRGIASIVFGLLVVEEAVPLGRALLAVVVATVALSVVAHGLTSVPFVTFYQRWYLAHAAEHPDAAEAAPTRMPRLRRQVTTAEVRLMEHRADPAQAGQTAEAAPEEP